MPRSLTPIPRSASRSARRARTASSRPARRRYGLDLTPLVSSLLLFLALGCSGSATGPETTSDPVAVSLRITPSRADVPVGDTVEFEVEPVDAAGEPVSGYAIEGDVTDEGVARVVREGSGFTVVGVHRGATRFRATATNGGTSDPLEAEADLAVEEETDDGGGETAGAPARVSDLDATSSSDSSVTLVWTQVGDGTGAPADYAVRYGSPAIEWGSAFETERVVRGADVGTELEFEYAGLDSGTEYEFQLVAFRGTLNEDAEFGDLSNVAAASTEAAEGSGGGGEPAPPPSDGDAVFADGFESGDLSHAEGGFSWLMCHAANDATCGVSADRARTGSHSFKLETEASPDGDDAFVFLNFAMPQLQEVWIEFYLRVPDNFVHRDQAGPVNNKFFGVWGGSRQNPDFGMIAEFERSQTRPGESGAIRYLVYENEDLAGSQWVGFGTPVFTLDERGEWVQWRWHIRASSVIGANAAHDGVIEIWKNGRLIHRNTEANLRNPDPAANFMDKGRLMGWSNSGYDQRTAFYYDDMSFWTEDPGW